MKTYSLASLKTTVNMIDQKHRVITSWHIAFGNRLIVDGRAWHCRASEPIKSEHSPLSRDVHIVSALGETPKTWLVFKM